MAHARRKFHELWVSQQSPIVEEALTFCCTLYDIERTVQGLDADERQRLRQQQTKPISDTPHRSLLLHRLQATDGTALARAIDYSPKRWEPTFGSPTTATCPSTTTIWKTGSGQLRLAGPTGSDPGPLNRRPRSANFIAFFGGSNGANSVSVLPGRIQSAGRIVSRVGRADRCGQTTNAVGGAQATRLRRRVSRFPARTR